MHLADRVDTTTEPNRKPRHVQRLGGIVIGGSQAVAGITAEREQLVDGKIQIGTTGTQIQPNQCRRVLVNP